MIVTDRKVNEILEECIKNNELLKEHTESFLCCTKTYKTLKKNRELYEELVRDEILEYITRRSILTIIDICKIDYVSERKSLIALLEKVFDRYEFNLSDIFDIMYELTETPNAKGFTIEDIMCQIREMKDIKSENIKVEQLTLWSIV